MFVVCPAGMPVKGMARRYPGLINYMELHMFRL
jgi:hypothetical protein